MKKSLIALAFGTLGLGIAEFTMMGILPYVATDLGISIPVAGHFISAYALGVCFGAPMLLLARKRPLKQILLVLMTLMIVGNICASMFNITALQPFAKLSILIRTVLNSVKK